MSSEKPFLFLDLNANPKTALPRFLLDAPQEKKKDKEVVLKEKAAPSKRAKVNIFESNKNNNDKDQVSQKSETIPLDPAVLKQEKTRLARFFNDLAEKVYFIKFKETEDAIRKIDGDGDNYIRNGEFWGSSDELRSLKEAGYKNQLFKTQYIGGDREEGPYSYTVEVNDASTIPHLVWGEKALSIRNAVKANIGSLDSFKEEYIPQLRGGSISYSASEYEEFEAYEGDARIEKIKEGIRRCDETKDGKISTGIHFFTADDVDEYELLRESGYDLPIEAGEQWGNKPDLTTGAVEDYVVSTARNHNSDPGYDHYKDTFYTNY